MSPLENRRSFGTLLGLVTTAMTMPRGSDERRRGRRVEEKERKARARASYGVAVSDLESSRVRQRA